MVHNTLFSVKWRKCDFLEYKCACSSGSNTLPHGIATKNTRSSPPRSFSVIFLHNCDVVRRLIGRLQAHNNFDVFYLDVFHMRSFRPVWTHADLNFNSASGASSSRVHIKKSKMKLRSTWTQVGILGLSNFPCEQFFVQFGANWTPYVGKFE